MKRAFSILLRLVISGVLLWLLFREHDLTDAILPRLQSMAEHWPWALAGLGCAFASLFLTAVRWHVILRGIDPELPFGTVLRAELVSAFFNISSVGVVGGDAYKIMSLSRRLPGKTMPVSVSLILDHLTGFVAVSVLFLVCVAATSGRWEAMGANVRLIVTGYAIYTGGTSVGLLISWFSLKPDTLAWGRRTFPRTFGLPKFAGIIARMARVHDIASMLWGRMLSATVVAIGIHVMFFLSFYCGLRAVGGMAPVLDVVTAMPIVDTAASLPVSISGLGVRERTFEVMLSGIAQVPESVCISASLAGWLLNLSWGFVGGLLFLRSKHRTQPLPEEATA